MLLGHGASYISDDQTWTGILFFFFLLLLSLLLLWWWWRWHHVCWCLLVYDVHTPQKEERHNKKAFPSILFFCLHPLAQSSDPTANNTATITKRPQPTALQPQTHLHKRQAQHVLYLKRCLYAFALAWLYLSRPLLCLHWALQGFWSLRPLAWALAIMLLL